MDIKDLFIGQARKYNCYIESDRTENRKCINCIRWRFSFPYTCNSHDMYGLKGETCLNYSEDKDCKVN